jgi:hypothetical protein
MRSIFIVSAIVALLLVAAIGQASAGPITYDLVNYPAYQNGYTLSGSITTDGATGTLAASDITAWSVTISLGSSSETFSSGDSGASLNIQDTVLATNSEIYLQPDTGPNTAGILEVTGSSTAMGADDLLWDSFGEYRGITNGGGTLAWETGPPVNGNWTIATASVPEPSSLILLSIASVGLAFFGRRTGLRRVALVMISSWH